MRLLPLRQLVLARVAALHLGWFETSRRPLPRKRGVDFGNALAIGIYRSQCKETARDPYIPYLQDLFTVYGADR